MAPSITKYGETNGASLFMTCIQVQKFPWWEGNFPRLSRWREKKPFFEITVFGQFHYFFHDQWVMGRLTVYRVWDLDDYPDFSVAFCVLNFPMYEHVANQNSNL